MGSVRGLQPGGVLWCPSRLLREILCPTWPPPRLCFSGLHIGPDPPTGVAPLRSAAPPPRRAHLRPCSRCGPRPLARRACLRHAQRHPVRPRHGPCAPPHSMRVPPAALKSESPTTAGNHAVQIRIPGSALYRLHRSSSHSAPGERTRRSRRQLRRTSAQRIYGVERSANLQCMGPGGGWGVWFRVRAGRPLRRQGPQQRMCLRWGRDKQRFCCSTN